MSSAYVVVQYLNSKLSSEKLSYFSDIWQAFKVIRIFLVELKKRGGGDQRGSEVGKHPDFLVGPPTATVFPTNDRKYKKSQFFDKNFEKI
jgi:hypothetical protein